MPVLSAIWEQINHFIDWLDPNWLEAFGTIFAASVALYFGLFGNHQTKLLITEKENQLDQEAFLFLTRLPNVITSSHDAKTSCGTNEQTSREFISEFENLILKEGIYVGQKKIKEYNYIIKLANDLAQYPAMTISEEIRKNREKLFYKIKREAEKKSTKVSSIVRLRNMRNLWDYESMVYWLKNIYLISGQFYEEKKHMPILVYTDSTKKARELAAKKFNDDFYLNESKSDCGTLSPKEYELLKKRKNCFSEQILFIYKGKKIKLKNDDPKNFKELGF